MKIPLNIDWQQILLHLLNFMVLAGGLYLLLYKPVKNFMESRAKHYQNIDEQANEALTKAEALQAEKENSLAQIDEEIHMRKTEAERQARQASEALLAEAKQQAAKTLETARKEAGFERAKILEDAQEEIARLAISATEKLVAQSASASLDQFLETVQKG